MQLLLQESPNNRTKLIIWQQATTEITPMITLLLRVHTTCIWVQFFAHIPFVVNHASTSAKKWQQNHSLQHFCTNWIFAGEGSIKADDVSFAAIIYITLVYRRHRRNNDYSTYHYQHGRQMNFSMKWPKKLFQGANSGGI